MNDPTRGFVALLTFSVLEKRLVDQRGLRTVCESSEPVNPLDRSHGLGSSADKFALNEGFKSLLASPTQLNWRCIQAEAVRLEKVLEKQNENRDQAHFDTRGVALIENNSVFDFKKWERAWSRRDLESVVRFFSEDGFWIERGVGVWAHGKRELRERLARFFHSFEGEVTVKSAKLDTQENEVELLWVRTGPRIPGRNFENLGSGEVRGQSNLWLEDGLISVCADGTEVEELDAVALVSWGAGLRKSRGTNLEAGTMATTREVKLNKPYRFKNSSTSPAGKGEE
jgi:hypothetical protein